jgi:group I intron endonuclease
MYKITDRLNNKIYIGQSIQPNVRWSNHKGDSKRKPIQYIHRAMAKYGIENFTFEVIATCRTKEDAESSEMLLIQQYDSRNPDKGYNIAKGGDLPWNLGLPKEFNPLTGIPRSKETKKKISEGSIGKIMPPASDERKLHMSEMYKGRILPKEWVDKIADSNRGQVRSKEARANISKGHIGKQSGENHPNKKLNWEIVSNIRLDYATGNFSKMELGRKYNVSDTNIYYIVKNKTWIIPT